MPKCQIFRIEFALQRRKGRREDSSYYLSREVPGTNNKPLPISLFLCDLSASAVNPVLNGTHVTPKVS